MLLVDAERASVPRSLPVLPVAPEDVPEDAVRAVKRTLLRQRPGVEDPFDDETARLVVAVVIAVLLDHPAVMTLAVGLQ